MILWSVFDLESKRLAATDKLTDVAHNAMKGIDMRYEITYGNRAGAGDCPVGRER